LGLPMSNAFQLVVSFSDASDRDQTSPVMYRDDVPDSPEVLTLHKSAEFVTHLGGDHSYLLQWSDYTPSTFVIGSKGIEK
jgi:hypothetical protein